MVKWCSISVSGMFGNTFKQFQCHKLHFMSLLIKLGKIYWDSRDLSAAIFKSPIAATRGVGELVSRQKWIPHTQIRLEQPLIHNCTILQCPKCYILHYSGFYCMSKLCLHVVSLFIPLPSILTSWILCYDSDDCTRSLRSLGEGGIIL